MQPISNPPNPWLSTEIEWDIEPPKAELEIYFEKAKSMLSKNNSPDLGFRYSVNPYRGCYHACAYCYARRSHQYWGFGAGTDFDRKLIVKKNAAEVLARELAKKSWRQSVVVFSGNTDCYQPIEAHYRLTRQCLEVCRAHRTSVAIITKSSVILRDADFLAEMAKEVDVTVTFSIAFDDDDERKKIEPYASPIEKRFRAMKALHDRGVRVGVSLAPLIPGLNEHASPRILERAKAHGASYAFANLVRLSGEVLPVFEERIEQVVPLRHKKIMNGIHEARGNDRHNDSNFGSRMHGTGERWDAAYALFVQSAKRFGLWDLDEADRHGHTQPQTDEVLRAREKRERVAEDTCDVVTQSVCSRQLGFDFE